jgi:tetratricopeptide (TPR) repeat protein
MTYYNLGLTLLQREPRRAADAFYWAGELNPGSADALYAQRIAILMGRPEVLSGYWRRDRRTARNPEVMRADSLYLHALELNPFLYHRLDGAFFDALIRGIAVRAVGRDGDTHEAEYQIRNYLARATPDVKAWRAYTLGRFDDALRHYATAIKSERKKASLRVDRGRLFFQLDRADSALTELTLAAEEMRTTDAKDLVFIYESKALVEHSIGMVLLRLGRKDEAREAFARALQEDLSYSPAHVQLGFMALDAKDTATAVSEFDLAVQIAPDDEVIRYYYGYTLLQFGKAAEAEAALRQAAAINPVYSAPQLALAQSLAAQGKTAEAGTEFRRFLAGASRTDPRRVEAEQQLATLSGGSL